MSVMLSICMTCTFIDKDKNNLVFMSLSFLLKDHIHIPKTMKPRETLIKTGVRGPGLI